MSSVISSVISFVHNQCNNDSKLFLIYSTISILTMIVSGIFIFRGISSKKLKQKLQEFSNQSITENKIILHSSKPWNVPTPHGSPAVAKLIAFFEYNNIEYILDDTMPKHFYTTKTPWITFKNKHLTDSNLIIQWILNNKSIFNINDNDNIIDSNLNKKQLSTLVAFKSMIENDLYFIIIWRRFILDFNIKIYLDLMTNNKFPSWLLYVISYFMKKSQFKKTWLHGIGRFNSDEIGVKHEEIMQSIFNYMDGDKFMFGDTLSTLDLSIYGHISGMYQLCSYLTWVKTEKKIPSKIPFTNQVNEYIKRIEIECFGRVKYWKDIKL